MESKVAAATIFSEAFYSRHSFPSLLLEFDLEKRDTIKAAVH